jgi:hypothetical protein
MTQEIYRHSSGRFRVILILTAQFVLPMGEAHPPHSPGTYLIQRRRWLWWRTLTRQGFSNRSDAVQRCRALADWERRTGASASR